MIKLLLIEDDANWAYILKSSLEEIIGGYKVSVAANGKEGLSLLDAVRPDIIVSDVKMPVMNGFEMVKRIRQTDKEILIVFATGKTSPKEVTTGYDAGVNNYIKKPFLPEELDAHIKALINLRNETKTRTKKHFYAIGKYQFDPKNLSLLYGSEKQMLTVREAQVLELLVDNKGDIVKRDDILLKYWDVIDLYTSRSLDVFITKIRSYLSKDASVKITNVKGVGLILSFD